MEEEKEYIPTTAERKILSVLNDPENYTLSISEICKKAEVVRNTYYSACKKPGFIKAKNEILNRMFENLVPDVKRAAMKYALNNAKNFQDRKMILEMTGEYKPQQDINIGEKISKDDLLAELDNLEKHKKV